MNHDAKVIAEWHDCGAVRYTVTCSCGYVGCEADGRGCWQAGHDQPATLDARHESLLQRAVRLPALLAWQPGPAQPALVVSVPDA